MTNELDQPTPGPWRWKFSGNAGNYFLLGNDGAGPITSSDPDSADGRLKQAAPALLAVLTDKLPSSLPSSDFPADLDTIAGFIDELGYGATAREIRAKAQAIRAAVAEAKGQ